MVDLRQLEQSLDHIRSAPAELGVVQMIVRRPAEDQREVLTEAWLDSTVGLVGDLWSTRFIEGIGGPDPEAQLTVVNARASLAIAGEREQWPLAGDQLYVDMDLSITNLPPGTRVRVGDAVIEFSAKPHTGCKKFSARYGVDALRFVSTPTGKELRLRGANCRVVVSGRVRTGDVVAKLPTHVPA